MSNLRSEPCKSLIEMWLKQCFRAYPESPPNFALVLFIISIQQGWDAFISNLSQ